MNRTTVETLVGEILTHIDIDPDNDVILLTTQSGRQVRIFHDQDCCESVAIKGTDGEWHNLIGKPIVEATQEESQDDTSEFESCTHTQLSFRVDDATVISRWIGTSNGCYSESVDLEEITSPG